MKTHALTTITLALVAAVAFETALAFEQLQPPRRWFDEPRTVNVDTNGLSDVDDVDGGASRAREAAEAWNNPSGSKVLDLIDAQSDTNARNALMLGDGISHMVFEDPFRVCERTCLAATFIGYYNTNQIATCGDLNVVKIYDSDIVFNAAPGFGRFRIGWTSEGEDPGGTGCSTEIYVETVTSHEVGHLIGLDHEGDVVALMNPSADYCYNKPVQPDDIAGRDSLYNCELSTGGGGSTCGNSVCESGEDVTNCALDCGYCGDDVASPSLGEQCDPPGTMTSCGGLGFNSDADATCTSDCSWDTSNCGLPKGAACTDDGDCASQKCKGPSGRKTCK